MTKEEVLAKLKFDVELRGFSKHTRMNIIQKLNSFRTTSINLQPS